jgi:hypothetical protein
MFRTQVNSMNERKLIIITNDLPYPPNYGHKVDQHNRWRGFAEAGWQLRLICWRSPEDPPTDAKDLIALGHIFDAIDVLPIPHNVAGFTRRIIRLPRYPSHVSSRIPDRATMQRITRAARAFKPAAIVLDGIYGGAVGEQIAAACEVRTILRGHNIEHVYFAQQAKAARGRSRLAWLVARIGLERYERALVRRAAWTFDVSNDDVAFWKAAGVETVSWGPTVYPGALHGTIIPAAKRRWDLAYIGNLRLPNNLRGIAWFIDEVLPHLRQLRPHITICFAGANPSEEARSLFRRAPEIELVPDVPTADEILSQGRVLVNPILSGSGINIKSIDMLRYDAVIVTTPVGVNGFPQAIRSQFVVREDPQLFAAAIVEALAHPNLLAGRDGARAVFGEEGLRQQMDAYAYIAGL